jgi:hypothetical protein
MWLVSSLSPWRLEFSHMSAHVGLVVDKVALEKVSLSFSVPPASIIPRFSILLYHLRDEH